MHQMDSMLSSEVGGGLKLINLEDAVVGLMTKWITKALEPSNLNLYLML